MSASVEIMSAINHQLSREQERRLFAAMAMQGILAGDHPICRDACPMKIVAAVAVEFADALITELAKCA
jgi:hypothetical protein